MQKWLNQAIGQTKDLVLRNSAQWFRSGRAKIFCQTKTHDSAARVKAEPQPRRFYAIFGHPQGSLSEASVPNLRKLKGETTFDNTNVAIEVPSGGFQSTGEIGIVDPVSMGPQVPGPAPLHAEELERYGPRQTRRVADDGRQLPDTGELQPDQFGAHRDAQ